MFSIYCLLFFLFGAMVSAIFFCVSDSLRLRQLEQRIRSIGSAVDHLQGGTDADRE